MRILIVYGGNKGGVAPFITEQVDSLKQIGVEFKYFLIKGKGFWGYLKNLPHLKKVLKEYKPDLIHAHYGLSGLFANLQRKIPVVTTYHGSDINNNIIRLFSFLSIFLSKENIFVSNKLKSKIKVKKGVIIPCGVNLEQFTIVNHQEAKRNLNLKPEKIYILFSSAFNIPVKNYNKAKDSLEILNDNNIELLEFKGYDRIQSNLLFNAIDLSLMTSFSEGSPQFIKEAMACNCPIVSTDVGDVKDNISGLKNCFIANTPQEIALSIHKILLNQNRSNGREEIDFFDNNKIANDIKAIYKSILQKKNL
jgi:glycosyltransferase involved in cell wall biosynthesis